MSHNNIIDLCKNENLIDEFQSFIIEDLKYSINKPTVKVGYDLQEIGQPDLAQAVNDFIQKKN